MLKYKVVLHYEVEVEAESYNEAKEKACDKMINVDMFDICNADLLN